jgi:hypothetical protein
MDWRLAAKLSVVVLCVIGFATFGTIIVGTVYHEPTNPAVTGVLVWIGVAVAIIGFFEDIVLQNTQIGERISYWAIPAWVAAAISYFTHPLVNIGLLFAVVLPAVTFRELYIAYRTQSDEGSSVEAQQGTTQQTTTRSAPDSTTATERDTSSTVLSERARTISLVTIAAILGMVAGLFVGLYLGPPVVVTILIGGLFTTAATWWMQSPRRFLASGAIYFLLLAATFYLFSSSLPDAYSQDAMLGLVPFGLLALGLEVARAVLGMAVISALSRVVDEEHAGIIWRAVSAVVNLLLLLYALVTWHEKLARYGGSAGVGTAAFWANLLGFELPIPVWWASGVDATVVLYVGAILVGFSVLDTLFSAWDAAKLGAKAGATGAKKGASAAASGASQAASRAQDVRENQGE